jgi:hypothetical protein
MANNPMPDQDIKLGTAAGQPATPVDPKTDMSRYYYRPGTTEPELRPEIAEAEARDAAKGDAGSAGEAKPLRGPLPDDFPGHGSLVAAGLTTYAKVRKHLDKFETEDGKVDGVGPATVEKIRDALNQSSEDEEEAE